MADTTEIGRKRACEDETSIVDTELAAKKPRDDAEVTTVADGTPVETVPDSKEASQPDDILAANASEALEENENADEGDEEEEEEEDESDEVDTGNDDATAAANGNGHQESKVSEAKVGPMVFTSGKEMYSFFLDLLRSWPIYHNMNKYEHLVLEDLLLKGHHNPQQKIGSGIEAFQIQINREFNTRCYYVIRKDGSVDDFSFKKCVNAIMPVPEDSVKSTPCKGHNKPFRGGGKGHFHNRNRAGRFGGRGRGGRGGRGGSRRS